MTVLCSTLWRNSCLQSLLMVMTSQKANFITTCLPLHPPSHPDNTFFVIIHDLLLGKVCAYWFRDLQGRWRKIQKCQEKNKKCQELWRFVKKRCFWQAFLKGLLCVQGSIWHMKNASLWITFDRKAEENEHIMVHNVAFCWVFGQKGRRKPTIYVPRKG